MRPRETGRWVTPKREGGHLASACPGTSRLVSKGVFPLLLGFFLILPLTTSPYRSTRGSRSNVVVRF